MVACVVITDMLNKCRNLNSHVLGFTAIIQLE